MSSVPLLKISAKNDSPVALVVGSSFLTAALSHFLLARKIQVICLGNFRKRPSKNLLTLEREKKFFLLDYDFTKPLPKFDNLNYIFHLDGLERYLSEEEITFETLQANSLGTQNLLELARQTKAKLLFASLVETFWQPTFSAKMAKNFSQQRGSFSYPEVVRFAESLTVELSREYNLNSRIVRLSDLYGPGMDLEGKTTLTKLIKAGQKGEALVIEGDGLEILYPTFVDDAVEGIIRATFLSSTAGKIYHLLGEKTTTLEVAQLLRKISGEKAEIKFKKEEKEELKIMLPPDFKETQTELGWGPQVSLEEGLKKTLDFLRTGQIEPSLLPIKGEKEISPEKLVVEEKRWPPSYNFLGRVFFSVLLLSLALLLPFLSLFWDVFWGQQNLAALEKKAESLSLTTSLKKAKAAEKHFLNGQEKVADLAWLFEFLRQEERRKKWQEKLSLGEKAAGGARELAQTGQTLETVGEKIFGQGEPKEEEILMAKASLAAAGEKWGEVEAKLATSGDEGEKKQATKLARWRKLLKEGENWLGILPQIIALDDRRTYLLLLQNNMEIRPTGGFLGSLGLLTFEKGKMVNLKIEDVYTVDGQLKGHVEPPEPIKKYLGKEHWFLRDSNWDPDFSHSAPQAQWFLEKEIGLQTQGVLAFDLNLTQNFLAVLGPVEVLDYGEKIDSQNLFEKTERYTEEDFFPGSTQKKDFLSALAKTLIGRVIGEKGKWPVLANVASRAVGEKHLFVYFNDPKLEQAILQNGAGGEVKPTPCLGVADCLGDYLLVVEANLGVNKVNYWVKKKIQDKIIFGQTGQLSHLLTLNFQNTSAPNTWGGGTYKNYLRIYTPLGTTLENLEIGGIATKSADIATASGKTVFGFYLEVPPQSEMEVKLSYRLRQNFSEKQKTYHLFWQKQGGTQKEPLTLEISYPGLWQVEKTDFSSLTQAGRLEYNGALPFNREFKVEFKR